MATNYDPEPFDEWGRFEQDLWLDMVDSSGRNELMQDDSLMAFYDIAFNTPKGDIPGDHRASIMSALRDYVLDEYGFDFWEYFDWEDWREKYSDTG